MAFQRFVAGMTLAGWGWASAGCDCGSEPPGLGESGRSTDETTTPGELDSTSTIASESVGESSSESSGSSTVDSTGSTESSGEKSSDSISLLPTTTGESQCGDGQPQPGEVCFRSALSLITGRATGALALGDFDDDGNLDVATGHDDSFCVSFGTGDGDFDEEVSEGTDGAVLALAVGDFDTNGIADLAVSVSGDVPQIIVLYGNRRSESESESGIFVRSDLSEVPKDIRSMAVGQFGGGDRLDLAAASENGDVALWFDDDDGNLRPSDEPLAASTVPIALAAGDIDERYGDDLVVANLGGSSASVFVHADTEDGFEDEYGIRTFASPRAIELDDFDADGNIDLAIAHQSPGRIGLWLGDGSGGFGTPTYTTLGGTLRGSVAGDIDDDGTVDLVVTQPSGARVGILLGTPMGFESVQTFQTLGRPDVVAAGDLDNDGALDLITATSSTPDGGGVAWLPSDP